jgi:hypothetical protein
MIGDMLEGSIKLFVVFTLCLVAPVFVFWGIYEALHYIALGVSWFWMHYWGYVVGGLSAIVIGWIAIACFMAWLPLHQARQQRDNALSQLGRLHQEAIRRMGDAPGSTTTK